MDQKEQRDQRDQKDRELLADTAARVRMLNEWHEDVDKWREKVDAWRAETGNKLATLVERLEWLVKLAGLILAAVLAHILQEWFFK